MMTMVCSGVAPVVPAGEAGLSSFGYGTPHSPQPAAEAIEGGAGGGAPRPLQLPESWVEKGRGSNHLMLSHVLCLRGDETGLCFRE